MTCTPSQHCKRMEKYYRDSAAKARADADATPDETWADCLRESAAECELEAAVYALMFLDAEAAEQEFSERARRQRSGET